MNTSSKKNLQHFNNECCFFQVSKFTNYLLIILFFQSWSSFVHSCLLCSSLSPLWCSPCSHFLCCERRNMNSKEKLKHWISEHHFFSSEQVHQLPPHDYNLFDHGCFMFMVILCSSSSPLWCPLAPFFCCGRKSMSSKEKLQNYRGKNKAQLVALVVIFQVNKFIAHPFVIFFNHMVIFYSWSFCVVCYNNENEI